MMSEEVHQSCHNRFRSVHVDPLLDQLVQCLQILLGKCYFDFFPFEHLKTLSIYNVVRMITIGWSIPPLKGYEGGRITA